MKTVILTLSLSLLAALLLGMATIFFGLFNVSARGGHWPVVSWVLHTTYRHSVSLRAPAATDVPELDDLDLVTLGARHYQQACAVCHGEPFGRQRLTMQSMLPPPPPIAKAIEQWGPNQLFWIIKHGVKMSGMPHWPAYERDDDIWPVVAFLERLDQLDSAQYRQFLENKTRSSTQEIQGADLADLHNCTLCHGASGNTDNAHIPRLDILSGDYLSATLKAYRGQQRASGIMQHAASTLDDASIEALSTHYASMPRPPDITNNLADEPAAITDDVTASAVVRGRQLAAGGTTGDSDSNNVPACIACHGPWPEPLSRQYPSIAAQSEEYLLAQLKLWKSGKRGGTSLAKLMHAAVPELGEQQMEDLAAYYARLPALPVMEPDEKP